MSEQKQYHLMVPLVTTLFPIRWEIHFHTSPDLLALRRRLEMVLAQQKDPEGQNAKSIRLVLTELSGAIEKQENFIRLDSQHLLWLMANTGVLSFFNVKQTDLPDGPDSKTGHA